MKSAKIPTNGQLDKTMSDAKTSGKKFKKIKGRLVKETLFASYFDIIVPI